MGLETLRSERLEGFKSPGNKEGGTFLQKIYKAADILYNNDSISSGKLNKLIDQFGDEPFPFKVDKGTRILKSIVRNFTLPVSVLTEEVGCSADDVFKIYEWVQGSKLCAQTMNHNSFPGYLSVGYASGFYKDLIKNPDYLNRVLNGEPVAPKKLEIHSTNANCTYSCLMCLWHVDGKAVYKEINKGLLTKEDWKGVLKDAGELGTETVIFSGGGEPLLRSDNAEIIKAAKEAGLYTMVYTNGSKLYGMEFDGPLYQALLSVDWLRISLHAITEEKYAKIVGLPENSKPFKKVVDGLKKLVADRDRLNLPLKLGMGSVIQELNYDQVEEMASFAVDLGLDFLNFRVDCISITKSLSKQQNFKLYSKLNKIRENLNLGQYGKLKIDFDDRLVALMNGWKLPEIYPTTKCRVHLYRPAIDPFGRVGVCDLAAEPFFSRDELTLGHIGSGISYKSVINQSGNRQFDASKCVSCMPGQQVINSLWNKVLEDIKIGIQPKDQALCFN